MSRAFQTFLQDFVFLIQRPMATRTEPVRTGPITARLSPFARQSENQSIAPLARHDFSRSEGCPPSQRPELFVWKAQTQHRQEILCSASNRAARRG